MIKRNNVELICYLIVLIWILLFCYIGCAPRIISPIEIPKIEIEMESMDSFKSEEKIEKPEKPNPITLNIDFVKTEGVNQTEYFAFKKSGFAKIIQLSKAFDTQEKVIDSYEDIISLEIGINNNLKNIINDRTLTTQYYADLYIQQQNLRLQENYSYEKEKFFNKTLLFLQSGVLIILTILSK